jgi:hypothetical protein
VIEKDHQNAPATAGRESGDTGGVERVRPHAHASSSIPRNDAREATMATASAVAANFRDQQLANVRRRDRGRACCPGQSVVVNFARVQVTKSQVVGTFGIWITKGQARFDLSVVVR